MTKRPLRVYRIEYAGLRAMVHGRSVGHAMHQFRKYCGKSRRAPQPRTAPDGSWEKVSIAVGPRL